MPGGPIYPYSTKPLTATRVFPHYISNEEMMGVEASLGADSTWELYFEMPPTLPSGTAKLRKRARANATSGNAKVNVKWCSVAMEEDPDDITLNAEGVETVTWGASDDNQYKEAKTTLDADTVVGGEILRVQLVFETASWTLAQISGWLASVWWE